MGLLGFGGEYEKPGKGVSKNAAEKHRYIIFLEVVGRKFWKLVQLSLLFTLMSVPAIALYYVISSVAVPNILGLLIGRETVISMASYLPIYALVFAAFLLLMLGAGPASCAAYYILRNYSREEHAWLFSDFFDQFGKNFKQGMAIFGINTAFIVLMVINLLFYASGMASVIPEALQVMLITAVCIISAIFLIMQMYIYPMTVTFNLKVRHILRNALLFAIYKLPQNILLLAATLLSFGAVAYFAERLPVLYAIFPCFGYALIGLAQTFYAFGVISSSMIKPDEDGDEVERMFEDTI